MIRRNTNTRSRLTQNQYKLIVESLRELGVNVFLALLLTILLERSFYTDQLLIPAVFASSLWYISFVLIKKIE